MGNDPYDPTKEFENRETGDNPQADLEARDDTKRVWKLSDIEVGDELALLYQASVHRETVVEIEDGRRELFWTDREGFHHGETTDKSQYSTGFEDGDFMADHAGGVSVWKIVE